MTNTH